jgi:nucleoside-diphosphate-sugar epimerase
MDHNDRILVTGGTGFIGGRLVEVLAKRGLRLRVATSDFGRCARISSLPVELVKADLNDHSSLDRAAAGCSIVFHFGYRFGGVPDDERRVNLDGTRALAEAFLRYGGRRFVHISSIAAYGEPCDGEVTEATPLRPIKNSYGDIKQRIELVLLDFHRTRGLPVSILQPTIVYGPYGYFFTIRLLEELRSTRIALPAGGICNAVYVDDVVSASILAVNRDAAVGEKFIISGPSPATWRQFYGAYEKMLNREGVVELDDMQIEIEARRQKKEKYSAQLRRTSAKRPDLRRRLLNLPPQGWLIAGGRRILSNGLKAGIKQKCDTLLDFLWKPPVTDPSLFVHQGFWHALYAAKSHARIDKARNQLGYDPVFDLDEGMTLTAEWARKANLLSA